MKDKKSALFLKMLSLMPDAVKKIDVSEGTGVSNF